MTLDKLISNFASANRTLGLRGFRDEVMEAEFALREGIEAAIKAEREACAVVCDEFDFNARVEIDPPRTLARYLAAAIRARI